MGAFSQHLGSATLTPFILTPDSIAMRNRFITFGADAPSACPHIVSLHVCHGYPRLDAIKVYTCERVNAI